MAKNLSFKILTPAIWDEFEVLFGDKGACGGCWCQWWKVKRSAWDKCKGEVNRQSMKAYVDKGGVPGILGYIDGIPVAWCAVEPRDKYPVLERSRILKNVDDQPVWSVPCFYIKPSARGHGLSVAILSEAVRFVSKSGGLMLEGYPVLAKKDKLPAAFAWTGLVPIFKKAGFHVVDQPSSSKVIMRYKIK